MVRLKQLLAIGAALLLAPFVQADESWVGLQVLTTRPHVRLSQHDGDKQVEFAVTGSYLPVLEEQDGRVRVRDYVGREGWADKSNFVRLNDATAYFTQVIRRDAKDPWAWTLRGVAYALNGDRDRAIEDYTEALRLDPEYVAALLSRAGAWGEKSEWDKAIRDLDDAIRIDPNTAALGASAVFNHRGVMWLGKQEFEKAIHDFDEAIRLNPIFALAFKHRGEAWEVQEEYDKAICDYSEAIRLGLKDIRLDLKDSAVFVNRGNAWFAKKEYEKAIRDYDEAIAIDPESAVPICKKSFLLATCADDAIRDVSRASDLMNIVVEKNPSSPFTQELVGVIAAAHGKFKDAIKHQKTALENDAYAQRRGSKARAMLAAYKEKMAYRE